MLRFCCKGREKESNIDSLRRHPSGFDLLPAMQDTFEIANIKVFAYRYGVVGMLALSQ